MPQIEWDIIQILRNEYCVSVCRVCISQLVKHIGTLSSKIRYNYVGSKYLLADKATKEALLHGAALSWLNLAKEKFI